MLRIIAVSAVLAVLLSMGGCSTGPTMCSNGRQAVSVAGSNFPSCDPRVQDYADKKGPDKDGYRLVSAYEANQAMSLPETPSPHRPGPGTGFPVRH